MAVGNAVARIATRVFVALCATAAFFCILPLPIATAGIGLDPSWGQALHVAFERGLQFGTDLAFTYGPLGFIYPRMYWPGLVWVTLAFWLLLAAGTLDAWAGLLRRGGPFGVATWVVLAGALSIAGTWSWDALVFVYVLLWALQVEAEDPGPARLAAHGAFLGLVALTKLTFAMAGGLAIGVVTLVLAGRHRERRALIPGAAAGATFLLGWLALGQSLPGLVPYLANGLEIVTGYPEAMALRGPLWEMRAFAGLTFVVLGLAAWVAVRRRDLPLLLAITFGGAMFALAWKQAFTRHDAHAIFGFVFLAVAAGALGARLHRASRRCAIVAQVIAFAGLALAVAAIAHRSEQPLGSVLGFVAMRPVNTIPGAYDLVAQGPAHRHAAALAEIRATHPVPPLAGTVDVYSYDQAAAFAHGLRWHPRPVFQSYSAYTAPLAELNRRHLLRPDAPDHLLVRVQAIDGRLAALEDGASWLTMLERYSLRSQGAFVVLDREREPRPATVRALPAWEGRGWREVPREGALRLAAITVADTRSLAGAFKGPPMRDIEVRTADGRVTKRRFIRDVGRARFVLSPLVENSGDFAALFTSCATVPPGRDVTAIRMVDGGGREIPYRLELAVADTLPRFPEAPGVGTRALACDLLPIDVLPQVRDHQYTSDGGSSGLNAHPPATFRVVRAVRSARICTRLHSEALAKGRSDGYGLKLVIGGKTLAGLDVPAAKLGAEACISAALPGATTELELRVTSREHGDWDWVYITSASFE